MSWSWVYDIYMTCTPVYMQGNQQIKIADNIIDETVFGCFSRTPYTWSLFHQFMFIAFIQLGALAFVLWILPKNHHSSSSSSSLSILIIFDILFVITCLWIYGQLIWCRCILTHHNLLYSVGSYPNHWDFSWRETRTTKHCLSAAEEVWN